MESRIVALLIEQSAAIVLFVGLLYGIQACLRSSRDLEGRNQARIKAAHRIRSGAFRQSVAYLRSAERFPGNRGVPVSGTQEPKGRKKRL